MQTGSVGRRKIVSVYVGLDRIEYTSRRLDALPSGETMTDVAARFWGFKRLDSQVGVPGAGT